MELDATQFPLMSTCGLNPPKASLHHVLRRTRGGEVTAITGEPLAASDILQWALIWYWDHLKNFIAEIPQGPLGMSIGTIWVTQKRSQGPPERGF